MRCRFLSTDFSPGNGNTPKRVETERRAAVAYRKMDIDVEALFSKFYNQTTVSEFLLVGFSMLNDAGFYIFGLICIIYILSVIANTFIIIIVKCEYRLHKPMYFFIGGLSFLEIWYPSVTVPRLLWALLTKEESISSAGCLTQFFFHFSFGATENFLLTVMSIDRFVAICKPLRYLLIMNQSTCTTLIFGSWIFGFIVVLIPCLQISKLSFCFGNKIDHYYCDFAPLIKLSCTETSHIQKMVFVSSCFVILGCFLTIIVSYTCIIQATMNFPTSFGRQKTFSTCASHLIVVIVFYATTIFMFVRPTTGDLLHLNKTISVIPSIVTPLLNPIIYTLRNNEVKEAIKKNVQGLKMRIKTNFTSLS
ncbi:olfactory receptor 6F1-like [Rhinoderma darwinii]|uniref:olfactory receptor 6F1-like n=1 Tax=Rhinoderma darwinii TaxID=43563 RepID=UPI003F6707FF